jgi:hypothetical protein
MTRTETPLRARVREAGLTPAAVATALNFGFDINRVLDDFSETGSSYEKVVAFLDRCERDGYVAPVPPVDLRTKDERYAAAQAAADEAFLAPRRAAQEASDRVKAWQAEERERMLVKRAEATAGYLQAQLDRITKGMDLREMREDAGLGLNEVAALIGTVEASQLDRIERGIPFGNQSRIPAIEIFYRTLPRFTATKKAAKS